MKFYVLKPTRLGETTKSYNPLTGAWSEGREISDYIYRGYKIRAFTAHGLLRAMKAKKTTYRGRPLLFAAEYFLDGERPRKFWAVDGPGENCALQNEKFFSETRAAEAINRIEDNQSNQYVCLTTTTTIKG